MSAYFTWQPQPVHEHRLLGLVLFSLYLVNWDNLPLWFSQLVLLGHFAVFVLWQTAHSSRNTLPWWHILLAGLLIVGMAILVNPWLILLWKLLLISLLGGRHLLRGKERWINYTAIAFLSVNILIQDIVYVLNWEAVLGSYAPLLRYGLLLVPLSLLLFSADEEHHERAHGDFFQGLVLSLLLALWLAGSLFLHEFAGYAYLSALLYVGAGLAGFLLLMIWLWVQTTGINDLSLLWSQRLLNLSTDFEKWLSGLVQPGNYKHLTPEQFLETGLQQVATVPWMTGLHWQSNQHEGELGETTHYRANVIVQSLEVTVYAHRPITGQDYAHIKLLIQLLEHFHQAKQREEEFAQQAHLQAIHETGAKLTHDIKNLLQSLYVITSAIDTATTPEKFGDTVRLWKGQLPHLTQRLKRTLDKLQQPSKSVYTHVPVRVWWDNLCARYRKRDIEFSAGIMWNAHIPEDLFDNVVENLLENALNKRKREPSLRIHVALSTAENQVQLNVCDDGSVIPSDVEKNLLNQPVPSRDGFGIGLYQASKQTIHTGYRLRISHNQPGQVCFELASV